jgi:hypothetical protein
MLISRGRVFGCVPAVAVLALWLVVAGVSLGFAAVPALAEESEATEAPVAEAGQEPYAPAAEGEATGAPAAEPGEQPDAPAAEVEASEAPEAEAEAASSAPGRPRSRVVRPDPSDLDDAGWDSSPRQQEALAAPGTAGVIECIAGC